MRGACLKMFHQKGFGSLKTAGRTGRNSLVNENSHRRRDACLAHNGYERDRYSHQSIQNLYRDVFQANHLLTQRYVCITLLCATVTDQSPVRRSLNAVDLKYLLTAVTADNHTLTHSLSPSIDTLDSEGVFLTCYQSRKTMVTAALNTVRKTRRKI